MISSPAAVVYQHYDVGRFGTDMSVASARPDARLLKRRPAAFDWKSAPERDPAADRSQRIEKSAEFRSGLGCDRRRS